MSDVTVVDFCIILDCAPIYILFKETGRPLSLATKQLHIICPNGFQITNLDSLHKRLLVVCKKSISFPDHLSYSGSIQKHE